jgi:hypothetical protein
MKKYYPALSTFMSALIVATIFTYLTIADAIFLQRYYYRSPLIILAHPAFVIIAYIIVELTINRKKLSLKAKVAVATVLIVLFVILFKLASHFL